VEINNYSNRGRTSEQTEIRMRCAFNLSLRLLCSVRVIKKDALHFPQLPCLCKFYLPRRHLGVSFLLFFVMQRQWWLELNFKVHRISNESFAGGSPSHACDGRKTQELAALSLIKKEQAAARWWKIASALRCRGDAGALPFIKLYYAGNRKFWLLWRPAS